MNTNERAFQRVAKISKEKAQKQELSAEKVELSFEGDKDKFALKAKAAFDAADEATDKYRKAVDEVRAAKKEIEEARKMLDKINADYGKAQKAFRDLGIDPPSYIGEIDGKGMSAWENDLIDFKQILESYVKN